MASGAYGKYGKNNTGLREDVLRMKRRLYEIDKRKERDQHEESEKKRKEEELEKFRKREQERLETERKTKKYFYFDQYDRKKYVPDYTYFFGEHEVSTVAWRPDGMGQLHDKGVKRLDGKFVHGHFTGGEVVFPSTAQRWSGHVVDDLLQGTGTLETKVYRPKTLKERRLEMQEERDNKGKKHRRGKGHKGDDDSDSEDTDDEFHRQAAAVRKAERLRLKDMVEIVDTDEVIAHEGEILCRRKDLEIGTRIEFFGDLYATVGVGDSTQLLYSTTEVPALVPPAQAQAKQIAALASTSAPTKISRFMHSTSTGINGHSNLTRGHFHHRATIIEHRGDWKYLLRMDAEVYPRDRIINLASIGKFRIMHEAPRVFHLHAFPAVFNHPQPHGMNNTPYAADPDQRQHYQQQLQQQRHQLLEFVRPADDYSSLGDGSHHDEEATLHSQATSDTCSVTNYNAPTLRVIAHPDHPRHTNDYREHLAQHLVTKRKLLPSLPTRPAHAKRENYFETRLLGIGAAEDEAKAEEHREAQKLQWQKLIAEKKAAFAAERQRQIEEETQRQLQMSVKEAVRDAQLQAQQDAEEDEMTRRSALSSVLSEFGEDD